jgi:feruloyl esterase
MGHCNGAYEIDFISELEQWVEGGEAPDTLLGRRLPPGPAFGAPPADAPDLGSRPICAYPNVAVYSGSGSDSDPATYSCQATERGARERHRP